MVDIDRSKFEDIGRFITNNNGITLSMTPKNASTSIRTSLNLTHHYWQHQENKPKNTGIILKVLREPMDRLVSGYLEVCVRANIDAPNTKTKKFYHMIEGKDRFVEFINEIEREFFDPHILPQWVYMGDINGIDLKIDYFLDFDNLNNDLNNVLGINVTLNHSNVKPSHQKQRILKYIENDIELQKRILKLYYEDFKLYDEFIKNK